MKVEVWSDYVCPFCYIGKKQLEKAIEDMGYKGQVEVEYKSYLLDPNTPVDTEETVYSELSKKYGMPIEKVKEMTKGVEERAAVVGLHYDFSKMKSANTLRAHRLAKWAETKGKGQEFTELVLKAYFLEYEPIGKQEVLLKIAEELGLDVKEAEEVINGDQFTQEVEQDIEQAQSLGVRGVPFFVFENKYGISGAQPQEIFERTIKRVAEEKGLKPKLQMLGEDGANCIDGQCNM